MIATNILEYINRQVMRLDCCNYIPKTIYIYLGVQKSKVYADLVIYTEWGRSGHWIYSTNLLNLLVSRALHCLLVVNWKFIITFSAWCLSFQFINQGNRNSIYLHVGKSRMETRCERLKACA